MLNLIVLFNPYIYVSYEGTLLCGTVAWITLKQALITDNKYNNILFVSIVFVTRKLGFHTHHPCSGCPGLYLPDAGQSCRAAWGWPLKRQYHYWTWWSCITWEWCHQVVTPESMTNHKMWMQGSRGFSEGIDQSVSFVQVTINSSECWRKGHGGHPRFIIDHGRKLTKALDGMLHVLLLHALHLPLQHTSS